jgi:hypothetical protein
MITLIKQDSTWDIEEPDEATTCTTIEIASDYLLSLGVLDDEIDLALISIYVNEHKQATFKDGKFVASV